MSWKSTSGGNLIAVGVLLFGSVLATSCDEGSTKENEAPETQISVDEINLTGDNRLNSTVSLSWFGTDGDGYIEGYEVSFDEENWSFTEQQDSVFSFSLPEGQDTTNIDFYVRSIDNDSLRDPTPAYLSVPLKNSAPIAAFNNEVGPLDTSLIVATFVWNATDPDGDETVRQVELKVNDSEWQPLNLGETLISFVLDPAIQSGLATADLYYGTENTVAIEDFEGFNANGMNTLYIRASDIAGAVSSVDTSNTFYLKNKTPGAELLWVSGQGANVTEEYQNILDSLDLIYDLEHYGSAIDGSALPSYWEPTFSLILQQYPKVFVNSGQEDYTNRVTSRTKTLLEFMAPVVQEYTNQGGKSFITTSFNQEKDLLEISGPYPVASLVTPSGQARIQPDSALVPLLSGNYPPLSPVSVRSGMVPIVPTDDSDDFYRAQLLKLQGWEGTDVVAAIRRPNNVWTQVFFAVELHYFDQNPQNLVQLFEEILINEF